MDILDHDKVFMFVEEPETITSEEQETRNPENTVKLFSFCKVDLLAGLHKVVLGW
jgi:hypothetical protein